jgi:hypothetical protein
MPDDLPDGEIVNGSFSTNAPHVQASSWRILRYDREFRDVVRSALIIVLIEAALVGGAVWLFATGHWILGSLAALLALPLLKTAIVVSVYLPRGLMMVKSMYRNALLTPGIVISANPVRLACLAAMGNGMGGDFWGLKVIETGVIPLHAGKVGEVVPCVSVFDSGEEIERWADFTPRPISWGTADPAEVRRCLAKLDQDELKRAKELVAARRFPAEPGKVLVLDG